MQDTKPRETIFPNWLVGLWFWVLFPPQQAGGSYVPFYFLIHLQLFLGGLIAYLGGAEGMCTTQKERAFYSSDTLYQSIDRYLFRTSRQYQDE